MRPRKLYALLTGVNDYTPNVGRLNGCLNDVEAYEAWLTDSFPAENRSIAVLKDSAATRQGIIDGFRQHLAAAGPNDVALFQFAGHGARWKSSSAFNPFYPEGFDEGLVCWDSRREPNRPGSFDLADKELAVLVAELAERCSHVVVLLDCCHSGSGTRSADDRTQLAIRMSHQVDIERPLDTYLDGHYSRLVELRQRLETPASRHILLAACERKKQAFEGYDRRGIFSSTLLEQLDQCHGQTTYADLFLRVRATVRKKAHYQTPQFEVFRGFDGYQGFLGGEITQSRKKHFLVNHDPITRHWTVEFGAIHGFVPVQDKPLEFAIVQPESNKSLRGASHDDRIVGTALAQSVGLSRSILQPQMELPTDRELYAEITSLPANTLMISVSGEPVAVERLRAELEQSELTSISLVDETEHRQDYGVEAVIDANHGPLFTIQHFAGSRTIQSIRGHHDIAARHAIRSLAHIAEWETRRDLQNHNSAVDPQSIPFHFVEQRGAESIRHSSSSIRLTVGDESTFGKLVTQNPTGQSLYSLLVHFSDDYGMTILDNDEFPPTQQERTLLLDGFPDLELFLDADGPRSSTERFMLIVSSEPIDQFVLSPPDQRDSETANVVLPPLPSGIIDPLQGRKIRTGQGKLAEIKWFTTTIEIELCRAGHRIGNQTLTLDDAPITVHPHPTFSADLQLRSATLSRSIGDGADFWLAMTDENMSLVTFSQSRGQNLSVMELSNFNDLELLRQEPLAIDFNMPLLDNESLVAFTFDGEHILLVGECRKAVDGRTRFTLDEIPKTNHDSRSVASTLRLYFFKTCFKLSSVGRLRAVNFKKNGGIKLEQHSLRERVAKSQRIVLLIPGLLGDGAWMATALHPSNETSLTQNLRSSDTDSVFLVWDYEQLSTTLQTSAQELHDQLAIIGLGHDDEKELVIVGHGIGGLLARWLIEQGEGRHYVNQLIMLGAPNGGAPLGKVGMGVTAAKLLLTISVNLIPGVASIASYILSVLINLNRVTATIDQLDSDGEFLRHLNASTDPNVFYTIVSGDVSDVERTNGRLADLLLKLGQGRLGNLLFDHAAHDLFVSVGSSRNIPSTRVPAPQYHDVNCHHFAYMDALMPNFIIDEQSQS